VRCIAASDFSRIMILSHFSHPTHSPVPYTDEA
jgi:hypothetical protein